MKKINNILLWIGAVTVLTLFAACEDFLEKRQESEDLIEEDLYKDYNSIRGYLDFAYRRLDNYQFFQKDNDNSENGGRVHVSAISDESATTIVYQNYSKFWSGSWTFTDKEARIPEIGNGAGSGDSEKTPIWRAYRGIRNMNRVIQNYDRVPMTDAQKDEIAGQAYFYRAWFYFQLLKRYGGMPILDEIYDAENDNIPRVTYHESHDWMMEDIEKAIAMLPDDWDDANYGRPTKIAAMAFKSMAQLYDASPLMQNGLESTTLQNYDRDRAALAARSAYEAIRYIETNAHLGRRLATADEYMNQFWFEPSSLKQVEHLWYNVALPSPVDELKQNTLRAFWLYPKMADGTGAEALALTCPTLNIVNMYEMKGPDGVYYPITDSRANYSLNDNPFDYDRRDPRFRNNILVPGTEWGTYTSGNPYHIKTWVGAEDGYNFFLTSNHTNQRQFSGFMNRKWLWPTANREYYNNASTLRTHRFLTVFIRVSQLYLDYTEALFEATGSATATIDGCPMTAEQAINIIRNRIGVTNLPADFVSDASKFREAYRRERAVELMFENHRWWDLRRWMIMHEVFSTPYSLQGMRFHPKEWNVPDPTANEQAGLTETVYPTSFTYEPFTLNVEIRNFSSMANYWYPLPQFMVNSKSEVVQNPGW